MSVILENRRRNGAAKPEAKRPVARASSIPAFLSRPRTAPPGRDAYRAPLWGLSYDRVEGVIHLVLAFTIVGGAAAIMSTALFGPGAPLGGSSEAQPEFAAPKAAVAVAAPVEEEMGAKPAPATETAPAAAMQPAAPQPAAPALKTSALDPFLDARPMTETAAAPARAPEPLAPPPASMREKLGAGQGAESQEMAAPPDNANVAELPAAPAPQAKAEPASPARQAEAPADDAHMAKCYLKLSGRVQNSGSCKVHHTAEAVTFDLPGKPLEIAHKHGRVWTATLGGRNLGQVYKTGACWGAKGFYACENG
ncbi:hypothetical protein [Methylocystis iwaonis]|nr:hypothetical protein [Methylocystis iwaonis]